MSKTKIRIHYTEFESGVTVGMPCGNKLKNLEKKPYVKELYGKPIKRFSKYENMEDWTK